MKKPLTQVMANQIEKRIDFRVLKKRYYLGNEDLKSTNVCKGTSLSFSDAEVAQRFHCLMVDKLYGLIAGFEGMNFQIHELRMSSAYKGKNVIDLIVEELPEEFTFYVYEQCDKKELTMFEAVEVLKLFEELGRE